MPAKNRTRVSARPQDFHRPLRLLQHGAVGRILEGVETFHRRVPTLRNYQWTPTCRPEVRFFAMKGLF
jgi:hypothetical protein